MVEWDIRKLQILRTLRERGTVTATAEALRMTPSAVSQQLTNLAKQVGVPLLEAHGRRVRLTDAARRGCCCGTPRRCSSNWSARKRG
ncbi:LysR family transcriptional regulator [Streptomyces chartreusis]